MRVFVRDFLLRMVWATWWAIGTKLAFGTHPSAAVAILFVGAVYAAARGILEAIR